MYTSKFTKEEILRTVVKFYTEADNELMKAEKSGDFGLELQLRKKFLALRELVSELQIVED